MTVRGNVQNVFVVLLVHTVCWTVTTQSRWIRNLKKKYFPQLKNPNLIKKATKTDAMNAPIVSQNHSLMTETVFYVTLFILIC